MSAKILYLIRSSLTGRCLSTVDGRYLAFYTKNDAQEYKVRKKLCEEVFETITIVKENCDVFVNKYGERGIDL